jgi:hypothetical protein
VDWLTSSFNDRSVAWIVLSSFVGGLMGVAVKFGFEDVLRPILGLHRETRRVVQRYRAPLVRSADSLERRLNILIRNEDKAWFTNDEYFRISTLYQFGVVLGWIRVIEQRFGFLPFETSRRGSRFNQHVNGIFRALSSHAYFRGVGDAAAIEASAVPRLMLTAVGEAMSGKGEDPTVIGFTDFVALYSNETRFRRWFLELENFLAKANLDNPLNWDRLIATAANLRGLIRLLDPKGAMVNARTLENLERIKHPSVVAALEREFPHLTPARRSS